MKFIVREGKRRGKGTYLTYTGDFPAALWHFTRKQRRAYRFDTYEDAVGAAMRVWHITVYRVVKLKEKN